MTIRINHNRNTALERSVINQWGLNPVYIYRTLAPGSAVVHKPTNCSVRVNDFLLINKSKPQIQKSRFSTEMTRDEYSIARSTLKRWSNRNPTIEPR